VPKKKGKNTGTDQEQQWFLELYTVLPPRLTWLRTDGIGGGGYDLLSFSRGEERHMYHVGCLA